MLLMPAINISATAGRGVPIEWCSPSPYDVQLRSSCVVEEGRYKQRHHLVQLPSSSTPISPVCRVSVASLSIHGRGELSKRSLC